MVWFVRTCNPNPGVRVIYKHINIFLTEVRGNTTANAGPHFRFPMKFDLEAKFKKWSVTRWPHEEDDVDLETIWQRWQELFKSEKWLKGQIEHGEKGDQEGWHIQAAVHLKRPVKCADLVKRMGGRGVHLEPQIKDNDAMSKYVHKPTYGDEFAKFEHGTPDEGGQGKRTDLKDAALCYAKEGKHECATKYTSTYVRYHRGVEKVGKILAEDANYNETWRNVKVIVIWGGAGAGKTTQARILGRGSWYEPGYGAERMDGTMKPYFNGYNGESTIIFNEYRGEIRYTELMKILDGHPYRAEERGGEWLQARWTQVIFTSAKHPRTWYRGIDWEGAYNRQLRRRLNHIIELTRPAAAPVTITTDECKIELKEDEDLDIP